MNQRALGPADRSAGEATRQRPWSWLSALVPLALLLLGLALPAAPAARWPGLGAAWAGPVEWREVPASATGRQWWDAGSLRRNRRGTLSVLSRFQPLEPADGGTETMPSAAAGSPATDPAKQPPRSPRQPLGTLVVMELDCDLALYRDISVNGLPRFNAPWQPIDGDPLATATLRQACAAAQPGAASDPVG